uniref:alpha-(1,6)-fucosyltransferase n=1 Tax=Ciona intestinalis TaxID=7719 RepID=UPI00089DA94A|nr:alpha-(1,6)-fucosyltransferase [Ciona intestinalis]|eukprot:XP_018669490.1 alpha-(1,6)-fucosyltransferase [Ciona intestinalis]
MLRRGQRVFIFIGILLSALNIFITWKSCVTSSEFSNAQQSQQTHVDVILEQLQLQQNEYKAVLHLADDVISRLKREAATTTTTSHTRLSTSTETIPTTTETQRPASHNLAQDPYIRKLLNDAHELQLTFRARFGSPSNESDPNYYVQWMIDQQNALINNIEEFRDQNLEARGEAARKLQDLVQKRINYLQNPKDCRSNRKLVCAIHKKCGFGCQLHHLSYCMMTAYGTGRTMILVSKLWLYNPGGWEEIFEPLSATCTQTFNFKPQVWRGELESANELEVMLPAVDQLPKAPRFAPLGIPEDLADELDQFHGSPGVWWVGQFIKYIFRPRPWLRKELDGYEVTVDYSTPIVGVHVRRTDKIGKEASFHAIDEYMKHVDDWFDRYDQQRNSQQQEPTRRRVYLATDDPTLLPIAKAKFPHYTFVSFVHFSRTAGSLFHRYSTDSLRGVIADIHLLSKCNYLVCTFSSQVCRVAYELMQTLHPDASNYFHSLDDVYYYGGQTAHEQTAVLDHDPKPGSQEIELRVGDVVGIAGNHWDGFSKGTNRRTKQTGLYPSYKTKEIFPLVKYPTYPQANGGT